MPAETFHPISAANLERKITSLRNDAAWHLNQATKAAARGDDARRRDHIQSANALRYAVSLILC